MLFESIKRLLAGTTKKQLEHIAARSGVPLPTLIKIKYGATANPRIKTIERLAHYFTMSHD